MSRAFLLSGDDVIYKGRIMLIGAVIMLAGCLLVIKNEVLASFFEIEHRGVFSQFANSAARQNIAVVGCLLFCAGMAAFVFL